MMVDQVMVVHHRRNFDGNLGVLSFVALLKHVAGNGFFLKV